MGRLFSFELFKMSRRPRSYLGTATFTFISFAVMLGMKYGHISHMVTSW